MPGKFYLEGPGQGCKKFFFRSEHKISCWKIAPAISQNSLLFGGFWPISIVTWLELVFLKKSETDLTEFAYKWLHLFRKFMPTLKNRSGWLKFAPSNARVLADFLHPWLWPPGNFLKIGLKLCFFRSILNMLEEILLHVIHWVIQGREFMTNFIWRLIQGREFTINCSFNFFFLPLFHPLNFGCSQNLPVQLHYDPTCKICINMCTKRNYSQFREGN